MSESVKRGRGRPPLPEDVRKVKHNIVWPPALLACIKQRASERGVPVTTVVNEVMAAHFARELEEQSRANAEPAGTIGLFDFKSES